jgi:hypothetical protein
VNENVVLRGVPIEPSDPSGLEIDSVRCFRLSEDLFFLIPAAGPFPFFGDPGTRVVSFDMAWLRAGVAGDTVNVVSAGLGMGGCGGGAVRPVGWCTCGNAGTLNVASVAVCVPPNVAVADLGSGGMSERDSFSGTGGFSVCGAGGTVGSDVSIFNVLAFWPDNLLFRTDEGSLAILAGLGVV